jgi:hypothetical protein
METNDLPNSVVCIVCLTYLDLLSGWQGSFGGKWCSLPCYAVHQIPILYFRISKFEAVNVKVRI